MYKFAKRAVAAAAAAVLGLSLAGCSADGSSQSTASAQATEVAQEDSSASPAAEDKKGHSGHNSSAESSAVSGSAVSGDVPTQTDFSDKDRTDTWAPGTPEIKLNGDSVSSSSADVQVNGSTATVTGAGAYLVSGTLRDGQIVVEAGDQDDVQLVLDGADITCSDGPAIYVKSADKVILTLASGKENKVTDGAVYSDTSDAAPSAAIYAEEDLSINGTGALTVQANNNNGIATKDDLVIVDGSLTVTAPNHALKGKDSVSIGSGTFVLEAGSDGIQSDQDSDPAKGWIVIDDGDFTITAGNDGIQAETGLTIHGGQFTVTTNGGYENAAAKTSQNNGFGGGFRFPEDDSFGDGEFGGFGGGFHFPEDDSFGDGEFGGFGGRPDEGGFGEDFGLPEDGSEFGGFGGRPGGHGGKHRGQAADAASAAGTENRPTSAELPTIMTGAGEISASPEASASSETADETASPKTRPARSDAQASAAEASPEASKDASAKAQASASSSSSSSDSSKGLKAGGNILVDGGIFDLNCADDGVHSDASVSLAGGKFRIASGDDGVHAEANLLIRADVEIAESYEGLEGLNLQIEDGTITIKSSDDGVNAAGDTGRASLSISGGVLKAECGGDGIDSNGNVDISGGDVQVLIRSSADNCAIDAEGALTVTGGSLIYGGTGTGVGPQSGSSQSYVFASGSFPAGETVSLRQNGQELMSFTPEIDCTSLIFSTPGIEAGAQYEVYIGSTLAATATAGQGSSGMAGGGRGGFGMRPDSAAQNAAGTDSASAAPADGTVQEEQTARPTLPRDDAASAAAATEAGTGRQRPDRNGVATPAADETQAAG